MGLFSSTLSPKEVVDQIVREGVQSCKTSLSRIGGVPGARQTNELMLTWLAMDRVTWEVALSRLHGEAIDQIRTATGKHYGEILLRELAKHLDTPRRVSREEKRLLAISFAQQIRGRAGEWWGKLTEDDLDIIDGNRYQLVGKLQERYGYSKDKAANEVNERLKELNNGDMKKRNPVT